MTVLPAVAFVFVLVFRLLTKVGLIVGGLDTVSGVAQTEQKSMYCPVVRSRARGRNPHFYVDVYERRPWIMFSTRSMPAVLTVHSPGLELSGAVESEG